jgi:hypothetical protein
MILKLLDKLIQKDEQTKVLLNNNTSLNVPCIYPFIS